MYEHEKGIQARYLEYIKKFTNTKTGIYTRRGLITFKKSALFHDQVNMMIPEGFHQTEIRQIRHPFDSEPPQRIDISNYDDSIHFTCYLIDNTPDNLSVEEAISEFGLMLKCLNPASICPETGSGTGEQLPYAWIEFIKSSHNKERYHMLSAVPVGGQLLLVLFVCPAEEQTEWKSCLAEIRTGITLQ